MQKRSHFLLARALMSRDDGFPARRYQWAFLFGSVQPDCNPLSYLKGSLRGVPFGGHTYRNARRYILRRVRRLQARQRWNVWNYYLLGKLTHYVADAFTWPHNPHFPGAAREHHAYETRLRQALRAHIAHAAPCESAAPSAPLPDALDALHARYLAETDPGVERDLAYILQASALLMSGCRPAETSRTFRPKFTGNFL